VTVETTPQPADVTPPKEAIVAAVIGDISHLTTLPEVTLKIIQMVENPEATAGELKEVIGNDPALAARILKIVNSGFYGLPATIGSIRQAITLLGRNALKMIAITASLAKLFRGGQMSACFSAHDLWGHCIAVACGGRMLARACNLTLADEAFLAGLLHDVGILVEFQARRSRFIEIIERVDRDRLQTFREVESDVLGANHEDIGAALCHQWNFPAGLAHVAGFHHRPLYAPAESRTLVTLIHAADIIASQLEIGYGRTVEGSLEVGLLENLGLQAHQINHVRQELPAAAEEAAGLLRP
jgi:putative nucleotidyltransferase with HDIG domain